MAEPRKSVPENRDVPQKSFFSGADNISYDEKDKQCAQKMKDSGSCFTVFRKIKLVKLFEGFNSFRHDYLYFKVPIIKVSEAFNAREFLVSSFITPSFLM